MNKAKKILEIIRHDDKPLRRLMTILLVRLSFDLGKVFRIKIKIHDYCIRFHSSSMSLALWYNPNDRISDYTFITSYLKENDIYIDVGANIGTTLIPAARSIKGSKAIGFEPHPKIFSYLKGNVSLNNLDKSIELHNCALGKERGYQHFSSRRDDDQNRVLSEGKGIKVLVKQLDDFAKNLPHINLIKIDVEGYEKYVIEGAIRTLEKTDCIYFEVCEEHFRQFGYTIKDLLVLFERMGFFLFSRREGEVLESINSEFKLSAHCMNLLAVRNTKDFIERTGWQICDGEMQTG